MSRGKLESVQCLKDLCVTTSSKLKFSQHYKYATGTRMLGFINRNVLFKNINKILPLCISLVRPHLEFAVQFLLPHLVKNIANLETGQCSATKMIPSL